MTETELWQAFAKACWECGSIEPRTDKFNCDTCQGKKTMPTDPVMQDLLKQFGNLTDARRFFVVMAKAHAANITALHSEAVRSAAQALDPSGRRLDALASVQSEENEALRLTLDRIAFIDEKSRT